MGVLNGGMYFSSLNDSFLVLIPKIEKKKKRITECMPISLCNVVYKLIPKTLTNRLKSVLPDIIDKSQCAFIKDHLITNSAIFGYRSFSFFEDKAAFPSGRFDGGKISWPSSWI